MHPSLGVSELMLFGQSYAGLESLSVYRASVVQRMRTLSPAQYVGAMRKPIRAAFFGCSALDASGHNAAAEQRNEFPPLHPILIAA
jgi:hypothetical protein